MLPNSFIFRQVRISFRFGLRSALLRVYIPADSISYNRITTSLENVNSTFNPKIAITSTHKNARIIGKRLKVIEGELRQVFLFAVGGCKRPPVFAFWCLDKWYTILLLIFRKIISQILLLIVNIAQ